MCVKKGFISPPLLLLIALALAITAGGALYLAPKINPAPRQEPPPAPSALQSRAAITTTTFQGPSESVPYVSSPTEPAPAPQAIFSPPEPTPLPPAATPAEPPYTQELRTLEREITTLYTDKKLLGPGHYARLLRELDDVESQTKAHADHILIGSLREKVESLLPSSGPAVTTPAPQEQSGGPTPSLSQAVVIVSPELPCASNPNPVFTADITDVGSIVQITPPGTIFDNGGVVKSHSYLWNKDSNQVPLYAPTDVTLAAGAHYIEGGISQYLLFFDVSCEVTIKLDHVFFPVDTIRNVLPQEGAVDDSRTSPPSDTVSFMAGELIGHTPGNPGSHNWDFGVYNTTVYPNPVTSGISNLAEIDMRADCAYDYFETNKRQQYKDLFKVQIGGSSQAISYCQ